MSVHHIRRRHHIRPRLYLGHGDLSELLQGQIIIHILPLQDAAVSVAGILTHTHITDIKQLRHFFFRFFQSLLDDAVAGIGTAS